jgi:YD repeat-containing protein
MRKLFLLFVLSPFFVHAQPTKEEIKKHRIRQVTEKRMIGENSQTETWVYGTKGYDSIQISNGEIEKIKNEFKSGKLIRKTHSDSAGKAADIYEYKYKPDGSYMVTYTDPQFKMKSFEWYNSKGNIIKSQSPDGNTTNYTYDGKGRLLSVVSDGKNDGLKINNKYTYNTNGQLVKKDRNTNNNLVTVIYEYDAQGRLIKELETGKWEGDSYEMESVLEYNSKGLLTKKTSKNKSESSATTEVYTYEYSYEYY